MTQPLSMEHTARAGSPARAVVHAAGVDTEYLRAGRGDAIVIVADHLDAPKIRELIAQLEGRYLVLAAAPALTRVEELRPWLDGFLEGLGVPAAHVLFHSSMTMPSGDHDHV